MDMLTANAEASFSEGMLCGSRQLQSETESGNKTANSLSQGCPHNPWAPGVASSRNYRTAHKDHIDGGARGSSTICQIVAWINTVQLAVGWLSPTNLCVYSLYSAWRQSVPANERVTHTPLSLSALRRCHYCACRSSSDTEAC